MALANPFHVRAEMDLARGDWMFWVVEKRASGAYRIHYPNYTARDISPEEMEDRAKMTSGDIEPSFHIPGDAAIPLLEELAMRIRPLSATAPSGELKAMAQHIRDLEMLLGLVPKPEGAKLVMDPLKEGQSGKTV